MLCSIILLCLPLCLCVNVLQNWGNEKLEEAQESTIENPWDVESWAILLREAQTRWINDVRSFFEKLVSTFPTSGRYWKYYIEMEVRKKKKNYNN